MKSNMRSVKQLIKPTVQNIVAESLCGVELRHERAAKQEYEEKR